MKKSNERNSDRLYNCEKCTKKHLYAESMHSGRAKFCYWCEVFTYPFPGGNRNKLAAGHSQCINKNYDTLSIIAHKLDELIPRLDINSICALKSTCLTLNSEITRTIGSSLRARAKTYTDSINCALMNKKCNCESIEMWDTSLFGPEKNLHSAKNVRMSQRIKICNLLASIKINAHCTKFVFSGYIVVADIKKIITERLGEGHSVFSGDTGNTGDKKSRVVIVLNIPIKSLCIRGAISMFISALGTCLCNARPPRRKSNFVLKSITPPII